MLELKTILEEHKKWLEGAGGARANLCNANLYNANLYNANLRDANLCNANLYNANLRGANLYDADLRGANLRDADLRDANLYNANLRDANLRGADLHGANLPQTLSVGEWCDAHDLATLPNGHRIAFKRVGKSQTTGERYGNPIKWSRGKFVEASDWSDSIVCGGGLHLSPSPQMTRTYSNGEICFAVSFDPADAVHLGDKLKVKRCKVL